ncbi:hypothetical protein [Flavihumibacter fluvii]|uniref:hypothetical protein n=1 Tax=Flavihumibacter fluvii TaxID=2838157 RepID=UPI001BDDE4F1|nr:hypothetical protein [Flavihumibacter fluvii]ULQ54255.1 hypothetical protein KJS93_07985 [Flavihumibacter fluvii]
MKKSIAILLLIIHGFNLAGYPAMFAYLQHKANSRFIVQIDNGEYSDAQLVEVKIPYPLPYSTNWKDYERVNGEMEVNGTHYNYVKRKLSNDTLYLMCIPNTEKTKLGMAKHNYLNVVNGVNDNNGSKKSTTSQDAFQKSFSAEYHVVPADFSIAITGDFYRPDFYQADSSIPDRTLSAAFQPPEA